MLADTSIVHFLFQENLTDICPRSMCHVTIDEYEVFICIA